MSDRWPDYLAIPDEHGRRLGGLRWTKLRDAVAFPDGSTFALAPEIALFVSGFTARTSLVSFAYVLHSLHWLGRGRAPLESPFSELRRTFEETGRRYRNAGALFSDLMRNVPRTALPVDAAEVTRILEGAVSPAAELAFGDEEAFDSKVNLAPKRKTLAQLAAALESAARSREIPPLSPEELTYEVATRLRKIPASVLADWLRHGEPVPRHAGDAIAREALEARPTLSEVLAKTIERPRLQGAIPLLAPLASGLVLPPRRLSTSELPLGGYADISTRGAVEQILPGQLALDSLEFVRRFAENELLYYRREEPHARIREELAVLVDQGARTWGPVRIVLAAAALALGKLAAKKNVPFTLATTGSPALASPEAIGAERLGELLEASDLTLSPAAALEAVLVERAARAAEGERHEDLVVLTHPRNLEEAGVLAAAKRVIPPLRLFAVTADDAGRIELCEVRHGAPVTIAKLRVDLTPASPVESKSARGSTDPRGWLGDVERVPFPFVFAPADSRARAIDFDGAGEWVAVLAHHGIVVAHRVDGKRTEVWPRAILPGGDGAPLRGVTGLLGVAGGFVTVGINEEKLFLAHYDIPTRRVRAHVLGLSEKRPWEWYYFPTLHSVVARSVEASILRVRSLDLATGKLVETRLDTDSPEGEIAGRGRGAIAATWVRALGPPPPQVQIGDPGTTNKRPVISLDAKGQVTLAGAIPEWPPFTPVADGKPALERHTIEAAQLRGNVLGLATQKLATAGDPRPGAATLRIFQGPPERGRTTQELALDSLPARWKLSHDGRLLARDLSNLRIEVRPTSGGPPLLETARGAGHSKQIELTLGDLWLAIEIPQKVIHLVRWDGPELIHYPVTPSTWRHGTEPVIRRELEQVAVRYPGRRAGRDHLPRCTLYDRVRFVSGAQAELIAVTDRYGHVTLFENDGTLLAMIFVWRSELGGWLADGTRLGASRITGGPASPDAKGKFARALQAACARGRVLV